VAKDVFSRGDQQWLNFLLPIPKLKEKHFSNKALVAKYQIYKSRGGPWIFLVPPLFRRPWLELFERNIIKDEINV